MVETPPGDTPEHLTISVRELCKIARVIPTYLYAQAREGKAPNPRRGRVPLAEALSWLEQRAAKHAARADAAQRLREMISRDAELTSSLAVGRPADTRLRAPAKEGEHEPPRK